ncbi:hypothetical protein C8F04DRAFT_654254 [Mycena alexandri]|uniref:Uncharacterized protein n=1 Tax=Mycena alexandri TaxID=1745969 RepID=A0AAD6SR61_9AGAR|nr:hypothetical protein C8F04DRAFT_654254 [Mycena alexandri]
MSPATTAARNPARRATWAPLTNYGSKLIEKLITSEPSATPAPARSTPNLVESPEPTNAQWSPLTPHEARALIRGQLFPGHAPPFVLSEERRNTPRSEINRLSRKMGRENTLRRTHHVVHEVGPVTADQRILRTFRRKSYTAPSNQFECCTAPLW